MRECASAWRFVTFSHVIRPLRSGQTSIEKGVILKIAFNQVVAAAALSAAAFSAQAVDLTLSGWAAGPNGYVAASGTAPSFNTNAGAFTGSLGNAPGFNANPFTTYCVQLTQYFSLGNTPLLNYSVNSNAGAYFDSQTNPNLVATGATIADRLGKLFTSLNGVNVPVNATQSAAIQLAVWESIYEGANPLSLTAVGGLFTASSTTAVLNAANAMLTAAAQVTTSLYSISVLESATQQDFLLVSYTGGGSTGGNVPEPASLGLVALALGGLALSRRRRA